MNVSMECSFFTVGIQFFTASTTAEPDLHTAETPQGVFGLGGVLGLGTGDTECGVGRTQNQLWPFPSPSSTRSAV